jgi:hypothetical protein
MRSHTHPTQHFEWNGLLDAAPSARTRSCRCRSCLLMALPVAVPQTPHPSTEPHAARRPNRAALSRTTARRTPHQPRRAQLDHRTPRSRTTAHRSAGPPHAARRPNRAPLSRTTARRAAGPPHTAQQDRRTPLSRTTAHRTPPQPRGAQQDRGAALSRIAARRSAGSRRVWRFWRVRRRDRAR